MTADNAPSPYVASASKEVVPYLAWQAFASGSSTGWISDGAWPQYIQLDTGAGNAWALTGYAIQAAPGALSARAPQAWRVEGSNDLLRWSTLNTESAQTAWGSSESRSFGASGSAAYRYFRVFVTASNDGTYTEIGLLSLTGTAGTAAAQPADFAPHAMTSASAPSPYVVTFSSQNATYPAWKAFDGSIAGPDAWVGTGGGADWIALDLGAGASKLLAGYAIRGPDGNPTGADTAPKDFTLEGSNDGSSWTVVDTRTNQTGWGLWPGQGEVRYYAAGAVAGYRYFRLHISANNGNVTNTSVLELYLFGTGVTVSVFSSSRDLTLYAQLQSGGPRAILNSSGTWTSTGVAKLRFNAFNLAQQNAVNTPTYKTGKRSPLLGVRGRQAGTFSLSKPFIPSGAAGTAPDDDPVLQACMGQAGTVVASTSVTYSLADALNYLLFLLYNKTPGASSPTNSYALGCVPQTIKFTGGGNFLDYEVSGVACGVGDSVNFSAYTGGDAVLKGGLTTYPAEPSSVTQNGNVIAGFGGNVGFSIGGSALAEVRGTVEITISSGVEAIADALSDAYTIGYVGGLRQVSLANITCIDSDGSVLNALKQAAFTKAAQTIAIVFGTVAGYIVTFNLANVQIGGGSWQEAGAALNIQFGESLAHATSSTVVDDLTLALT